MHKRLVTFLGKGRFDEAKKKWLYDQTTYELNGVPVSTCFVADALAQILKPHEIIVLATDEAWDLHGENISKLLDANGQCRPERKRLPLGNTAAELWQQFDLVLEWIVPAIDESEIIFDITHSFRSQPFFASAAIDFVRSVQSPTQQLRVVYGAFEARDKETNRTQIWDLTLFVEVLDWSRALLLFLRTGRAEDVAEPTQRLGRELRRQWAIQGMQGTPTTLDQLGKALGQFGNDLATVRTGSLIAGPNSSAQYLLRALQQSKDEVQSAIPPLAHVLNRIDAMVAPLITNERLSEADGQRALQELATLYFEMGRYAEAAATVREGWISRYACSLADSPGGVSFNSEHRVAAEKVWSERDIDLARELAGVRNDIEHAGYKPHPMPPDSIKRKLQDLIRRWKDTGNEVQANSGRRFANPPESDTHAAIVFYSVGVEQPITPDEPLPPLPQIPRGSVVVIEGRAPVWRYGMALHKLHGSPAGAVAVYDPRLGAVIVVSHHPDFHEGQVLDVQPPTDSESQ